jgi:hypothetical protein
VPSHGLCSNSTATHELCAKQTLPLGINIIEHVHIYNTLPVLLAAYFTFLVFHFDSILSIRFHWVQSRCGVYFLGLSPTFWASGHSIDRDRKRMSSMVTVTIHMSSNEEKPQLVTYWLGGQGGQTEVADWDI